MIWELMGMNVASFRMHSGLINCAVAVVLGLLLAVAGCSQDAPSTGSSITRDNGFSGQDGQTYEIVYNASMIRLRGFEDAEAIINDAAGLEGSAENGHLGAQETDDGSACLTYSQEQYDYQVAWTEDELVSAASSFAASYTGCRVEVSGDAQTIDCYLTYETVTDAASRQWASDVAYLEMLCGQKQILSHPGDGAWRVVINVYNAGTGKLVATGGSDTGNVTFNQDDWKASE